MDTKFMNSENGKTSSKQDVLILKLTYKLDLRIGKNSIALSMDHILYKILTVLRLLKIKT